MRNDHRPVILRAQEFGRQRCNLERHRPHDLVRAGSLRGHYLCIAAGSEEICSKAVPPALAMQQRSFCNTPV